MIFGEYKVRQYFRQCFWLNPRFFVQLVWSHWVSVRAKRSNVEIVKGVDAQLLISLRYPGVKTIKVAGLNRSLKTFK